MPVLRQQHANVTGLWHCVYRAVDQYGQVIDILVPKCRDNASAGWFFTGALRVHRTATKLITDKAPALSNVIDEVITAAFHNTGHYEINRCEADHGGLRARLRPMRGLKTDRTAKVMIRRPRDRWACEHLEPSPRPLRTGSRDRAGIRVGDRIQRTPTRDLNSVSSAHEPTRPTIA